MKQEMQTQDLTREMILEDITGILEDMTSDWDNEVSDPIGLSTKLIADLFFESIDIVQLVTAIEEKYRRRNLPFQELLMKDGRYVDEIVLGDLTDFLYQHLNRQ